MKNKKTALFVCISSIFTSSLALSSPQLILTNGKIFTADSTGEFQESLAIEQGKILGVGRNDDIKALAAPDTQVIDLQGKVVMPGFIDSHSHPLYGGLGLLKPHVDSSVQKPDFELLSTATRRWAENSESLTGDVVVVVGLDASYWAQAEDFNKIFNTGYWKNKAVFFMGSDQHSGWANKALRQKAGLDKAFIEKQPDAVKKTIGQEADGSPNGLISDASADFILKVLPKETDAIYLKAGEEAVSYYNKLGITSLVDAAVNTSPLRPLFGSIQPGSTDYGALNVYRDLARESKLRKL